MSKSKEMFMETRQGMSDIGEYFEWLADKEWQEYLNETKKLYMEKYKNAPATFKLAWSQFLIDNNCQYE